MCAEHPCLSQTGEEGQVDHEEGELGQQVLVQVCSENWRQDLGMVIRGGS